MLHFWTPRWSSYHGEITSRACYKCIKFLNFPFKTDFSRLHTNGAPLQLMIIEVEKATKSCLKRRIWIPSRLPSCAKCELSRLLLPDSEFLHLYNNMERDLHTCFSQIFLEINLWEKFLSILRGKVFSKASRSIPYMTFHFVTWVEFIKSMRFLLKFHSCRYTLRCLNII